MYIREFQPSDKPAIRAMFEKQGLPYDFPDLTGSHIECVMVVCDDEGVPIMASAAERILQLYLWSTDFHPSARVLGIKLLHEAMAAKLREKGYHEANAFLPPQIAETFGSRLMRTFRWVRNWPSFAVKF